MRIDPQPTIIIADSPPYNNYTLTCSATIPGDLVHLQTTFTVYGFPSLLNLSSNYTPTQDCQSIMFTRNRSCSYTVTATEDSSAPESVRFCSVELFFLDNESQETVSVTRQIASVTLLVNGECLKYYSMRTKF